MSQIRLDATVGQCVSDHPNTSRVFEALRIDYCCGGGKSLGQTCSERQLDPQEVLDRLAQAVATTNGTQSQRWADAPLSELCDHIEQTHHHYLKGELPRLQQLITKLVTAHGRNHPELADVQRAFADLQAELTPHMFKEELILFPAIRCLEQAAAAPSFPFGTIANPIRMMELEHDTAGVALKRMRSATEDYAVPPDACNTYRAVLDGIARLENDMHQHVHKENNILFPRAIERERARASSR
jgi:regulator of cell morphogenesis and NO signaling